MPGGVGGQRREPLPALLETPNKKKPQVQRTEISNPAMNIPVHCTMHEPGGVDAIKILVVPMLIQIRKATP